MKESGDELIEEVRNAFLQEIAHRGMQKQEVSRRMGAGKNHLSQTLSGKNITLRTMARIASAMGRRVEVRLVSEERGSQGS